MNKVFTQTEALPACRNLGHQRPDPGQLTITGHGAPSQARRGGQANRLVASGRTATTKIVEARLTGSLIENLWFGGTWSSEPSQ